MTEYTGYTLLCSWHFTGILFVEWCHDGVAGTWCFAKWNDSLHTHWTI